MPTRKWKSEFLVNTTTTGVQDHPSVAALSNGGFVIGWEDDGAASSVIRAQVYDPGGVPSGAEFVVNGHALNLANDASPALVGLSGPNIPFWAVQETTYVLAPTETNIAGGVYTAAGALVRAQSPDVGASDNSSPDAASLGTSGAVAVWTDPSNQTDVIMR